MPPSENEPTLFLEIAGYAWPVSRPHPFGVVLDGPPPGVDGDYLHEVLLSPSNRDAFFSLIDAEGLVVCKRVETAAASYRRVRGKSSQGKLSQAEYYHHDGCSCPTKPRVVEIRFPVQDVSRNVATAIAPFPDVMRAQLIALPSHLRSDPEIGRLIEAFSEDADPPAVERWDQIQGRVTRMVRRELDAESCRAYFRNVDEIAKAYVFPWEMGESRLMANDLGDLSKTMQHRRAYQRPRAVHDRNGSLVKRWTAEEL